MSPYPPEGDSPFRMVRGVSWSDGSSRISFARSTEASWVLMLEGQHTAEGGVLTEFDSMSLAVMLEEMLAMIGPTPRPTVGEILLESERQEQPLCRASLLSTEPLVCIRHPDHDGMPHRDVHGIEWAT